MKHDDYPALYKNADATSLEEQKYFFWALKGSLFLLVISAALNLLSIRASWFAGIQIFVLCASLGLTLYLAIKKPQKIWYETRAVAESIKTIAWRFVMRAEPYNQNDKASAKALFIANVQAILEDNSSVSHITVDNGGVQISSRMEEIKSLDLDKRKSLYKEERVDEQFNWYRRKAAQNKKLSRNWFIVLISLHVIAIMSAIAKFKLPEFEFWPTSFLVAAASAVYAWLQTRRFQELATSYSLTAHEISLLSEKIPGLNTDEAFSDFVGDAENAFSREHTQWRARRDVK